MRLREARRRRNRLVHGAGELRVLAVERGRAAALKVLAPLVEVILRGAQALVASLEEQELVLVRLGSKRRGSAVSTT